MSDIDGLDSFLSYMQRVESSIGNIIKESLDETATMVIDWFYDKKINVYSYSDDLYDADGVSCDGYSLKYENIFVDIQPIGEDKVNQSYGYNIEANYEMYSSQLLQESDVIVWDNKTYKVQKIIPWDDYYISLLLQEDVNLNV